MKKRKHLLRGGIFTDKLFEKEGMDAYLNEPSKAKYLNDMAIALNSAQEAITNLYEAGQKYESEHDLKLAEANYRLAAQIGANLEEVKKSGIKLKQLYTSNYKSQEAKIKADELKSLRESKRRSRKSSLDTKISATTAIVGLIGGLFFLSSNLTGNVIGNMTNSNSNSNLIGAVFLVVGLVGSFSWFKKKK